MNYTPCNLRPSPSCSAVFQRVSAPVPDIVADIYPKGNKHVDDNGRPHGKKGNINKVFADSSTGYSYFFTDIGANPKHLPFDKVLEFIHIAKL
jgi:hypothetical protein